ncbi:hypothetical protein A5733_11485 [Mycobacterium sp. NS-7484]|uniref:hypothetical protein n=1 Tax=Mycobacterium sp. NS-7484 TaxID=1834161 RepID=UPI00096BF872|nr:hypothetical protein [Mycobacterium sp. NS-7484]OMB96487.1 hypothetical protein A5733_11485 [Mycobacterium sp. NS-7484]
MTFNAAENAHMVPTGNGGRTPEPELDPAWPDLVKLRWHAALVRDETGLDVHVGEAKYSIAGVPQRGYYSINLRYGITSSFIGPHTYRDAWTYLNGIVTGAQAVQQ